MQAQNQSSGGDQSIGGSLSGGGHPGTAAGGGRIPSFYQPVDDGGREDGYRAYLEFLARRNGAMDFEHRKYEARDAHLAALAASSTMYDGPFDEELFRRQYRAYDRRSETSAVTDLLLSFCKVNAGEAFGIEIMREARRAYFDRPEAQFQAEKIITNEEEYHTRYLVGATQYFGLRMNESFTPPLPLKILIHGLAKAPVAFFHSVLLGAELAGIYTFHMLLEATRVVLRDQPEVRDALEERLFAVLIDEVGHVSYNRLALGRFGLGAARQLFPLIHRGVAAGAEMKGLEAALERDGQKRIPFQAFDFHHLPAAVRERAFFA